MKKYPYLLAICLFNLLSIYAQSERLEGEAVKGFGATYEVENPDFETNLSEVYKVVFDVSNAPEDPAQLNKWIETVARFMNMHMAAGKGRETLIPVLVLHGNASYGLLKNDYYKEKFGADNPNIALFEALDSSGVEIILCGQTSVHRNLTKERRIPQAKLALSAMTVLIQLQNNGYQLINF